MADLAKMIRAADRPPRRPRGPWRRRIRFSIQLDTTELRILDAEAKRMNLATGAYVREAALASAFRERLRREKQE